MDYINKKKTRLQLVYGDVTLGVHGEGKGGFHYIFSYTAGGLESLVANGKEWLYRAPKPTFWRAVTDNDRGNGFPLKSGMWSAADRFIKCLEIDVLVDGKEIPFSCAPENNRYSDKESAESITLIYTYETITVPKTQVTVSYTVNAEGTIRIKADYQGEKNLPQLPVFGMRFIMPTCADRFVYEGLSGETYPDRKAGGAAGVYEVKGLPVTPYLVPQDCGMHMDSKWATVYRSSVLDNREREKKETALCFKLNGLAFSCLPYTAQELENATHIEELPPARRTVLCVYGAVRGVGGIDSWGSDVEAAYQIDAGKDISMEFEVAPWG